MSRAFPKLPARADGGFEALWSSSASARRLDPGALTGLPAGAQRYLRHAVAEGASLPQAVRLTMHGRIKLEAWHPFSAVEVISWGRGFLWLARVRMGLLAMEGGDRLLDGEASVRWKTFGAIPVVNASGTDIARSAAGRVNIESIWLPSALCMPNVAWSVRDGERLHAEFVAHGEPAKIDYGIDPEGRLRWVTMPRWGNPGGSAFRYVPCGGVVESERRFGAYTIPDRMRVGWHFGSRRFETEGEFFRVTIDEAVFR